jgi:predicted secreted protein
MADTGRELLILKNSVAIAGAQEQSISIDNSPVDITSIGDAGYRTLADFAGMRALDISISGVWSDKTVRDQALGATLLLTDITIEFADGGDISGDFYLASYEESGAHDGAVTFTASLQSSGAWTYTTAT